MWAWKEITRLVNKKLFALIFLGFFLGMAFIFWGHYSQQKGYVYNKHYCLPYHATAYNFFKYNSLFYWYEKDLYWEKGIVRSKVQKSEIPVSNHPVLETIGFPVLVGLLWKIVGTPSAIYIRYVELFMFLLSLFFIYQVGLLLFSSETIALLSVGSSLAFFPLFHTLIQARNDIFIYFGAILVLYVFSFVYRHKYVSKSHFFLLLLVALFQWVRSTLFFVPLASSFIMIFFYFINREKAYKNIALLALGVNIAFFWIPLMIFNYYCYGKFFVSPLGFWLLAGAGEFPNKWGAKCDDSWCQSKITAPIGSIAFDNEAMKIFLSYLKEDPYFFIKCFIKRIKLLLFWNFTWFDYNPDVFGGATNSIEKLQFMMGNLRALGIFFLQSLYIRIFLLIGYMGLFFAFLRGYYFAIALIFLGCMWAMPLALFSHIEDRYVVVHYWAISFFVAYFLFESYQFIKIKYSK